MDKLQFRKVILEHILEFNFPADIRELFTKLRSNPEIIYFIKNSIDEFQNTNNNLLMAKLAHIYVQNKKIFCPKFFYKIHSEILNSETPLLFLNLHSNISALAKLVMEKNHSIYILSDFPRDVQDMIYSSGILKGDIKIFPRDYNSILTAKHLLSSSKIVSATIDFRDKMPGIYDNLSDGMLQLAYLIKPNTFFGTDNADDYGNIECRTYRVNFSKSLEKTKQEILKFIQEIRVQRNYKWEKFDLKEHKKRVQEYLPNVHN